MTVFDPSTLHDLVDVHERPFVIELAATFRRMLRARVTRVVDAVDIFEPEDAMDSVLSLKVSASMTGAGELAELASGIETSLRQADVAAARTTARLLPAAAERAEQALDAYLSRAVVPA